MAIYDNCMHMVPPERLERRPLHGISAFGPGKEQPVRPGDPGYIAGANDDAYLAVSGEHARPERQRDGNVIVDVVLLCLSRTPWRTEIQLRMSIGSSRGPYGEIPVNPTVLKNLLARMCESGKLQCVTGRYALAAAHAPRWGWSSCAHAPRADSYTGRVWRLLCQHDTPLSAAAVAERLSMTASRVSPAIAVLHRSGLLLRMRRGAYVGLEVAP